MLRFNRSTKAYTLLVQKSKVNERELARYRENKKTSRITGAHQTDDAYTETVIFAAYAFVSVLLSSKRLLFLLTLIVSDIIVDLRL